MARWLAIEYDRKQARLAVASTRGEQLVIENLTAVPLAEGEQAGDLLAATMREQRIGKGPVLVSIPRASVELKPLTLPPSPDAELPELVRFQALREFNALGENWPLDFLPLTDNELESRQVLAAAISPDVLKEVRALCQKLGGDPERIVLRPCAAASLFLRREEARRQPICLLVDLLPGEADLTAVVRGRVVFTRTARLAHDVIEDPTNTRALIAEVRRSLAAVHNQLGADRVEAVYLWGDTPAHTAVAKEMAAVVELPVATCPPLDGIRQADSFVAAARPEHFVSLLGALADQAEKSQPAFDFLHPREAPPPPSQKRLILLATAAAVTLAAVGIWFLLRSLAAWDSRIEAANQQMKQTEPMLKQAGEIEKRVAAIRDWQQSNISWLDEVYYLSDRAPDFRQALLTRLQMSSYVAGGGELQLEGMVQQSSDVDELERAIRDENHRVEAKSRQQDGKNPRYAWRFRSQVIVAPPPHVMVLPTPGEAVIEAAPPSAPTTNPATNPAANTATTSASLPTAPNTTEGTR